MKLRNIKFTALAASVALLLTGAAAKADLNYDTSTGNDIVAAFSTGGNVPHTGNTYLVNLGNLSLYQGSFHDGNLHTVSNSGASILSDLSASGISTASGTWSLLGTDINGTTALLSKAETTLGVQTSPYARLQNSSAPGDIATAIFGSNFTGGTATANSDKSSATDPSGYGSYIFGTNSPTLAWETYANTPEGSLAQVLDLYSIAPGSGPATLIGGFQFDKTTGLVKFSSDLSDFAPVPEPSTYGFAAALVGFCAFRRARRSALVA